ncbi:uracil-DNA glycosylase [Arenibacter sp. TNZ]|uniref:uracil-DNA glycosylase n=1 Tax=Arenibacter TaxID=178469 RepID=UPI000CD3B8ED|nr:uracil-DNA glycosylase [Arenibacter catalasegens]MCM4173277.1 uracil-DNA glycosylase [Arenibacter sp. TNZ]
MIFNLHDSWDTLMLTEFDKPYFKSLINFVEQEYRENTCYPLERDIFAAFDHCHLIDTKVIIIGQDPYHGPGQANGLCFSVNDGVAHPPSLANIFKEIDMDLGTSYPKSGNLERWANQGVLLLNATLTVREHEAASHQNQGWEIFTDTLIHNLSEAMEGLIFLLWGGFAKKKAKLIDAQKHHILTSGHPSPLSANRGYWFGNKHFSKTNKILTDKGELPINWK